MKCFILYLFCAFFAAFDLAAAGVKNDNYLITFKQANTIAKEYFTYFKYKDLFSELDNFTEKLW